MDLGFVILCPDKNIAGLSNTLYSIKNNSYDRESLAVIGSNATAVDAKDMKELCQIHKGKDTITSLINVGMKKCKHEWAFLIFGGSRIRPYTEKKLEQFVKSEKDVLYPIVDRKLDFVSGSFDGVLINTKFFQEVGTFPEMTIEKDGMNDFEFAKMLWCVNAMEKKAIFKGIVGLKII
jgi:hypothetical protein